MRANHCGFSLIELMVVLAIIAGVAALVAPRLPTASARAELPLIKVLHAQLAAAVVTGSAVHIILKNKVLYSNSRKDVYKSAEESPKAVFAKDKPAEQIIYTLGPSEKLDIEEPQPSHYDDGAHPGVSFFPNGQMTGARWIYSTGEQRFRLRFSPFSARISVEPAV